MVLGQEDREFLDGHWENAKVTIVTFHPQIVGRGDVVVFCTAVVYQALDSFSIVAIINYHRYSGLEQIQVSYLRVWEIQSLTQVSLW